MIASGIDDAFDAAVVAAVALPAVTTALLAAAWWLGLRSRERVVAVAVTWAFLLVTAGTLGATIARWCGHACERIDLGAWFTVGHYTFRWTLCADDLSLQFAAFAALLTGSSTANAASSASTSCSRCSASACRSSCSPAGSISCSSAGNSSA
jgi:hypothetical protein